MESRVQKGRRGREGRDISGSYVVSGMEWCFQAGNRRDQEGGSGSGARRSRGRVEKTVISGCGGFWK